jgi:ABC-type hemin transport system ATPase subunit
MLKVQNVYWKNGRGFSLTDVSLTLHGGTLTALMGANGAAHDPLTVGFTGGDGIQSHLHVVTGGCKHLGGFLLAGRALALDIAVIHAGGIDGFVRKNVICERSYVGFLLKSTFAGV